MRIKYNVVAGLVAVLLGNLASGMAHAQQMILLPVNQLSGKLEDPITFDIMVDGGIGAAASWGTQFLIPDSAHMTYVPNFDGKGKVYRSLETFFDSDISDTSQLITTGTLGLNFYNSAPGMNLGYNGPVYLAEFQILLHQGIATNTDLTVSLAPLGIPPDGTAVQDDQGNNLLMPQDPTNPNANVWNSHFRVSGSGNNLRWFFGNPPQDVPEPGILMVGVAGLTGSLCLLRRRRLS